MENIFEELTQFISAVIALLTTPAYGSIFKYLSSIITAFHPWPLLALFLFSSLFMIWRLNAIERKGFEGTVIGTLVTPYCSGFANISFAYVMGTRGGAAEMVLENCIVNNVTNITILLGIPSLVWGMRLYSNKKKKPDEKLAHLSLILTLLAMLFFTSITWVLARDGRLDRGDGIVLVSLFFFWQLFQVFEVLKTNVRKKRSLSGRILFDLILVGGAAWGTYYSIEGLVTWVVGGGGGMISYKYLGVLSGLLMVVPNGMLAFYYSAIGRSDIAYSSQIGDAHICIPMCIGLYAIFSPLRLPAAFETGVWVILGAALVHLLCVGTFGRLPKLMGGVLTASYAVFIYYGILG